MPATNAFMLTAAGFVLCLSILLSIVYFRGPALGISLQFSVDCIYAATRVGLITQYFDGRYRERFP